MSLKTSELHQVFVWSLGDSAKTDPKGLESKPLRLTLTYEAGHHDVIAYVYNLVAPTASRPWDYKAVLRVPGQKAGEYGAFEIIPGVTTLVVAYHAPTEVFVIWDGSLHPRFKYGGNIQVRQSTVETAAQDGFARQVRQLSTGKSELVLACKAPELAQTIRTRLVESVALTPEITVPKNGGVSNDVGANLSDGTRGSFGDKEPPKPRAEKKERTMRFDVMAEIPMDKTHQLDQGTARFQTVRDGLPELVKNAKDQYARLKIREPEKRQIVVAANTEAKRLSVFDFAGATAAEFEGWYEWSSRTASRQDLAQDIEGGHGNGGKSFMVRGASDFAFMDSCFEGHRTQMGFHNDDESKRYKPGYGHHNEVVLNNAEEIEPGVPFHSALKRVGLEFKRLPNPVQAFWPVRQAFTVVELNGVRDWQGISEKALLKRVNSIPDALATHGQAAMSIETCDVWFFVDGRSFDDKPIAIAGLEAHDGFEELDPIPVPPVLKDPETGEDVETGFGNAGSKYLQLRTSARQLNLSDELRPRNCIRVFNDRNNVASWPVHGLLSRPPTIAFVHGLLRVPALAGDHLADSHRTDVADTSLTRALRKWAADQVEALALDIQRAQMSRVKDRDKEKANEALAGFRELMRMYLELDDYPDGEGPFPTKGRDDDTVTPPPPPPPTRWGSRIDEIIVESRASRIALATGTTVPISLKAYERDSTTGDLLPVRDRSGIVIKSEPEGIVELNDGDMITALTPGKATVRFSLNDGTVASEPLEVESVECTGLRLNMPIEPLLQGQRARIGIVFETRDGDRDDLFAQVKVDDSRMATVNRSGYCRAGTREGDVTVRAWYGADGTQQVAGMLEIGAERVPPRSKQGSGGGNIPEILLCGDPAPGTDHLDPEQRTHHGGEDYTTIIEDPIWQTVVWINPSSKESLRVRQSRGGSTGLMGVAAQTYLQFIALKCFEILKRLKVRQEIGERAITEPVFIQEFTYAEIHCAGFIDAAFEQAQKLKEGLDSKSNE